MRREATSISGVINGRVVSGATALLPDTLKALTRSLKIRSKCYRKQLRKCQRKMSERAVHDLRVEARRLLSLLDFLEPFLVRERLDEARHTLKCHLDTFDDLRDVQVQLAAVKKLRKGDSAASDFHRHVQKREIRLSCRACKCAKRLDDAQFAKLMDACRADAKEWLERANPRQANAILFHALSRAFAEVARLKNRIDPDAPRSIHCTRIAFKKFRYMVEALASQMPWANEQLLKSMRRYQGLMGDIQDAEVLRMAHQKYVRNERPKSQHALRFSNQLLRRRQRLIARYMAAADRLQQFEPSTALPGARRGKATHPSGSHAPHTLSGSHRPDPTTSPA